VSGCAYYAHRMGEKSTTNTTSRRYVASRIQRIPIKGVGFNTYPFFRFEFMVKNEDNIIYYIKDEGTRFSLSNANKLVLDSSSEQVNEERN
jgi:hypothetical protein